MNQKGYIVPLLGILVVLLLGVGYVLYKNFSSEKIGVNVVSTVATVPTTTPDISDWKTYKNEKYGFEFKYPESAKVTFNTYRQAPPLEGEERFVVEFPSHEVEGPPGHEVMIFDVRPSEKTQDELYNEYVKTFGPHGYSVKKFNVGANEGVFYSLYTPATKSTSAGCSTKVEVIHGEYIFNMPAKSVLELSQECKNWGDVSSDFLGVVSSFKFTK